MFVFSGRIVDTDPHIGVLRIRDETDRWELVNLFVDLVYGFIDPRIRFD